MLTQVGMKERVTETRVCKVGLMACSSVGSVRDCTVFSVPATRCQTSVSQPALTHTPSLVPSLSLFRTRVVRVAMAVVGEEEEEEEKRGQRG